VATEFYNQIAIIYAAFQGQPGSTPSAAEVSAALTALSLLAKNGSSDPTIADPTMKYITVEMGRTLDVLLRTFGAAGATIGDGSVTVTDEQLSTWQDLSKVTSVIQDVLTQGLNAISSNRSLQALIELDYITTANGVLEDKMGALEKALGITNNVVSTLTNVQDFKNQMVVSSRPTFVFDFNSSNFSSSSPAYKAYKAAASQYYGQPIVPRVAVDLIANSLHGTYLTPDGLAAVDKMIELRASIQKELASLNAMLSASQKGPNTLYDALTKVYNDMGTAMTINGVTLSAGNSASFDNSMKKTVLQAYVLDNYDSAQGANTSKAGAYQLNLTKAITAAQSTNDQQNEDVRNFLNLFEQYYKSASALLQAISQIIQKMAQGAKG
jgi:hypothetical protein